MYPNIPPNQYQGQQNPGYPPQGGMPGYPPQQNGMPGYPQQQGVMPGYPPQQAGMAYPSQQAGMPGYPPQQGGMPGYPSQQAGMPGNPPQQGGMPGYPSQQAGMPGYPPQQGGMPGYPPQQGGMQGFPPQQNGMPGYPQQQGVMPGVPQGMGAYPAQQQYGDPQYQQQAAPPGNHQQPMVQQHFHPQQQAAGVHGHQPQFHPTLLPAQNFNASNDAAALRKAMKGFGTDEDAIIEVLCRRTNVQRMEIVRNFKTAYGKDLISDIKSECRNNFLRVLVALLTPTYEYYARELYDAMSGEGTDEDVLIEVMCGLSNHDIRAINLMYGHMFGKTLEDALREDTSGCFKRMMVSLSTGNRDESMVVDPNSARIDAQALKDAGVGRVGTDESEFNRILCLRNYEQIKLIAQEYERLTGHTLEKDIKKEFSGDIEDALVAVLRCALNRSEFFARRLHNAMAGLGTNDRDLIRLVVTRSEIDMVEVKEEFQKKYGKSLKSFIKGDSSGDYQHALFALIGENRS